ncbi:MAG: hypothetical protein AB4372_10270 [Xenococcus sp. (in: cyanobacteria)]
MDNQKITPPDLDEAQVLLDDLLQEVTSKESELAGGEAQKLARGRTAVQRLKETTVTFGDPRSRLIPLTREGFQEKGVKLDDEIQQLMNQYDFYSMVVSVDPRPQPSVLISRLVCQLDFGPKGKKEPIVHRIIPDSKWQTLVNAGVSLEMGLDAKLNVAVGVDASELSKIANLPDYDQFQASVGTKDKFKAFIVLDGLKYDFGKFNLFAQGDDNSECYWRIEKPEIQGKSTVKFDIVFKVPKGWESIDLRGTVWIEPSIDWLNGELTEVFIRDLPSYIKDLFSSKDRAAKSFAVGTKEKWLGLNLPQA